MSAEKTWSKKLGLDLRWDKRKILIRQMDEKGRESEEIPKVQTPQVHEGKDNYLRYKQNDNNDDEDNNDTLAEFKKRTFAAICRLRDIPNVRHRGKRLRKIEGMLYHVITQRGSFDAAEADKIVDAYMICRERRDPDHHPLQTATVGGTSLDGKTSIQNRLVFSHPSVKAALRQKGFYLNNGPFSGAESLTLMKNFEKFLAGKGERTDRESIWNLMSARFYAFYRKTKMFCYVGENLNRSTYQIYTRLQSIYQPYETRKSDAKTDAYILARVPILAGMGVHKKYKRVGEEIERYRFFPHQRYKTLTNGVPSYDKRTTRNIARLVAEHRNRRGDADGADVPFADVSIADSADAAADVPFADIAAELGLDEEDLRSFWRREGARLRARASLPRWKLEDSLSLLEEIEEGDEEDENCLDFRRIYEKRFRGKVQDFRHLREHYMRVRRVVPYYMLDDLRSTVATAKKEISRRMEGRREMEEEEEEDDEGDEDDFQ